MIAKANIQRVIDIITAADNAEDARIKLMAEAWDSSVISPLIQRAEDGSNISLPQGIPADKGIIGDKYYLSDSSGKSNS